MERNSPCHCGSGLKYKHCHAVIDSAPPNKRLAAAQELYADQWHKTSESFRRQGIYTALARLLPIVAPKMILDVGTGSGEGVAALNARFGDDVEILSIDENPKCIEAASANLESKGIKHRVTDRLVHGLKPDRHILLFKEGELVHNKGITLVQSDLLCDSELTAFISVEPVFDIMTVWFVGTHQMRYQCENLEPLHISNPVEYRLRVQNMAYDLADKVLQKGGILQIADRGERLSDNSDMFRAHSEQAQGTTLKVTAVDSIPYDEIKSSKAIPMGFHRGSEKVDVGGQPINLAVIVATAVKE